MLRAALTTLDPASALAGMTLATLAAGAGFGTFAWWWTVERPRRADLRRQLELLSAAHRRGKRQLEQLQDDLDRAQEGQAEHARRTERAEDLGSELATLGAAVERIGQAGPAPELLQGLARVSERLERQGAEQDARLDALDRSLGDRIQARLGALDHDLERLSAGLGELARNLERSAALEQQPQLERALLAEQRLATLEGEKRELEAGMRRRLASITDDLAQVDRALELHLAAAESAAAPDEAGADPAPAPAPSAPNAPASAAAADAPSGADPALSERELEAPAGALPSSGRPTGALLALMDALEAERDLAARSALLRRLEAGVAEARRALRARA